MYYLLLLCLQTCVSYSCHIVAGAADEKASGGGGADPQKEKEKEEGAPGGQQQKQQRGRPSRMRRTTMRMAGAEISLSEADDDETFELDARRPRRKKLRAGYEHEYTPLSTYCTLNSAYNLIPVPIPIPLYEKSRPRGRYD